jgi:putative flippase GtrA
MGYVVGAIINYVLNKKVTFSDVNVGLDAVPRFSLVVITGLALNGFLMAIMDYFMLLVPYLLRQCVATAVTLLSNFYLHKRWTFLIKNAGESQ